MVGTAVAKSKPVHYMAWLGFVISLFAVLLAWYGSLHAEKQLSHSPLRETRGTAFVLAEPAHWYEKLWDRTEWNIFGGRVDQNMLELTERSKIARYSVQLIAFGLPFILGITACLVGATAMKRIEQTSFKYVGNFQAVFSIMIGGFASVIAGCMIVSFYVWPYIPSLYTR
jgi:hypothetical protein